MYGIGQEIDTLTDEAELDGGKRLMQEQQLNPMLKYTLALQNASEMKKAADAYQMQTQGMAPDMSVTQQLEQTVTPPSQDQTMQQAQPGIQQQGQQMQQKQLAQALQGKGGGLPGQPMQTMQKMSGGGIVGYNGETGSLVRTNPANVRDFKQGFEGTAGSSNGFLEFDSPAYGVRAADKILQTYGSKHGINTIADAISRFAPPEENDTANYVQFVAQRLGVNPSDPIDLADSNTRHQVVSAILKMESGLDMPPAEIAQQIDSVNVPPENAMQAIMSNPDRGLSSEPDALMDIENLLAEGATEQNPMPVGREMQIPTGRPAAAGIPSVTSPPAPAGLDGRPEGIPAGLGSSYVNPDGSAMSVTERIKSLFLGTGEDNDFTDPNAAPFAREPRNSRGTAYTDPDTGEGLDVGSRVRNLLTQTVPQASQDTGISNQQYSEATAGPAPTRTNPQPPAGSGPPTRGQNNRDIVSGIMALPRREQAASDPIREGYEAEINEERDNWDAFADWAGGIGASRGTSIGAGLIGGQAGLQGGITADRDRKQAARAGLMALDQQKSEGEKTRQNRIDTANIDADSRARTAQSALNAAIAKASADNSLDAAKMADIRQEAQTWADMNDVVGTETEKYQAEEGRSKTNSEAGQQEIARRVEARMTAQINFITGKSPSAGGGQDIQAAANALINGQ